MLDSRIIDMSFNKIFLKLVLGEEVPLTIDTLKVCCIFARAAVKLMALQLVDPELAASLSKLSDMSNLATSEAQTPALKVEDLALDFTLPGYDVELRVSCSCLSICPGSYPEFFV
jgi:E3 ubiquitin-protein ligase TRIP12